jgi:mannose-6-phosphate isomerase-like protein (cupin superfamily)
MDPWRMGRGDADSLRMSLIEPLNDNLSKLVQAAADAYAATGDDGAIAFADPLRATRGPFLPPTGEAQPAPAWLAAALVALPPGELAAALRALAPEIPWIIGGAKMPASFAGRSAYNEIVGPDGLAISDSLRFGLFVQAPESFYPPHRHAAEEFYYVLSGTARWQKGEEALGLKPPGSCIRHAPWQRHAMETAAEPLLTLWVWTGDLDMASYEMEGI